MTDAAKPSPDSAATGERHAALFRRLAEAGEMPPVGSDAGSPSIEDNDLWTEFHHPRLHLCGLCGNTGVIDTRGRVVNHLDVECGVKAYCICPNGRAMKAGGASQPNGEAS